MAQVLIVEPDEDVRASLRILLKMAGHHITEHTAGSAALSFLGASRVRQVVLCGNDCPGHVEIASFFTQIATDATLAQRHGYICLTTDPERIPPQLSTLLDALAIPIMRKPFNIEPLLELVDEVAARTAASARKTPPSA